MFTCPTEKVPVFTLNEHELKPAEREGTHIDEWSGTITRNGTTKGVSIGGTACAGFPTPWRKLEFYSATLKEGGWSEYAIRLYA